MSDLASTAVEIRTTVQGALCVVTQLPTVTSFSRQYLAEMVVIRLFAMIEAVLEDSACRMVCGAKYCDGTTPTLRRPYPTRGFKRARHEMCHFGRTEPLQQLRWSRAGEVGENLALLFPRSEHFVNTILLHGQFISDLRKVRNHIAHDNRGTRLHFQEVVRNYYGASVHSMTPGRMLLSTRFSPILVERFCRQTRIVLLSAIKASP